MTNVSHQLSQTYDQYYHAGASTWQRISAADKAANIVELCADVPHASLCDIGAGEGSILQRLVEMQFGEKLYALEISSTGAATIQHRFGSQVYCQLFDGYSIPFADHAFDLAILSHVLEHVEHPRKLLYEAGRIAPYLFVEVPLEDTAALPMDYQVDPVGHINYYSVKTLRRLLQTCGFSVIRQKVTNRSKASYIYQNGQMKGAAYYYIKEALLRTTPPLATRLYTYHCVSSAEARSYRQAITPFAQPREML